jgi:hypothetical protein
MMQFLMFYLVSSLLTSAVYTDVPQPKDVDLSGRWEGLLTQEAGGVLPEYKMVLILQRNGDDFEGYSEVWYGEQIYVKSEVKGILTRGFFLELRDTDILLKKDVEGQSYCRKTYQLTYRTADNKHFLSGKWQGVSEYGKCVPGDIRLEWKSARA